jgi:hypothetical protein
MTFQGSAGIPFDRPRKKQSCLWDSIERAANPGSRLRRELSGKYDRARVCCPSDPKVRIDLGRMAQVLVAPPRIPPTSTTSAPRQPPRVPLLAPFRHSHDRPQLPLINRVLSARDGRQKENRVLDAPGPVNRPMNRDTLARVTPPKLPVSPRSSHMNPVF